MTNGKSAKGRAARGGRVPSAEPARGTDGGHGDTQGPRTQQDCCCRGTDEPQRGLSGPQAGGSKGRAGAGWGQVPRIRACLAVQALPRGPKGALAGPGPPEGGSFVI